MIYFRSCLQEIGLWEFGNLGGGELVGGELVGGELVGGEERFSLKQYENLN